MGECQNKTIRRTTPMFTRTVCTSEKKISSTSSAGLCSSSRKFLCMCWLAVYILWAAQSPLHIPQVRGEGSEVKVGLRPASLGGEELVVKVPSPSALVESERRGASSLSSSPLHIWLHPEHSFGGKTRMFLFPRRKEELWSENHKS